VKRPLNYLRRIAALPIRRLDALRQLHGPFILGIGPFILGIGSVKGCLGGSRPTPAAARCFHYSMAGPTRPTRDPGETELFIALVAAVGTDVGLVGDQIATQLAGYSYTSQILRLSDYLAEQASPTFRGQPFDEELWDAMTAGDELRNSWERGDALGLHAISDIVATRYEAAGRELDDDDDSLPDNLVRHAFILRSLKTPDELETLRAVYGPRLIVIAAYSPTDKRLQHLAERIEDSRRSAARETWVHQPEELIARDEKEETERGQDVSGTFHRADFFVRGWSREVIRHDVERTLEILFGSPFRTPTRDEHAQFMAAGAALRSAEFGRQVGAAIATPDGSVVAVGTNEVPVAGGGSHWEDDGKGNRDFEVSDIDTNRRHFDELAARLSEQANERLTRLIQDLVEGRGDEVRAALEALREQALATLPQDLRAGGLKDLTEFGRAVHAEMNALLDSVRRGVAVRGCTLYTTTFPCHTCARHIIGAGISRVVFIEPYTKSRAEDLHPEAVRVGGPSFQRRQGEHVVFEPFVGVAPRRYLEMFDAAARERLGHVARKDDAGSRCSFVKEEAHPVFVDAGLEEFRPQWREYRAKESLALEYFLAHAEGSS
jgi:deoxycytidylate deaminase